MLGDLDLAKDDTMRALQLDTFFPIKDIMLRLMPQLAVQPGSASDELVALAQTDPAIIPVKSPKLLQPGPSQSWHVQSVSYDTVSREYISLYN